MTRLHVCVEAVIPRSVTMAATIWDFQIANALKVGFFYSNFESLVLRLGTGLCVAGVIWHFSTNYSISGITLYIESINSYNSLTQVIFGKQKQRGFDTLCHVCENVWLKREYI